MFLIMIGAFIGILLIHELAHAYAMIKTGVGVKEVGLGIPLPGIPWLGIRFGEVSFALHPFLIGAYVEPASRDKLGRLSYSDQVFVSGIAPLINILIGYVILVLVVSSEISEMNVSYIRLSVLVCLLLFPTLIAMKYMRFLCKYILPIVTIGAIFLVSWAVFFAIKTDGIGSIGGFTPLAKNIEEFSSSFKIMLIWIGSLSLILGLFNLVPFMPLDGGHIVIALLHRLHFNEKLINLWAYSGAVIVGAMIILTLINDLIFLFK